MANVVRNMVNIMGLTDIVPETVDIYKEFSVNDSICLPSQKPDIERLISSAFDVKVVSLRVIDTPAGALGRGGIREIAVSAEGERLTGKKLVVELLFKQKIQYVALEPQQSVHGIHNEFLVSEFIVIPPTFLIASECVTAEYLLANNMFYIYPILEDANVNMMNLRCISTNILALLQVNIKQCFADKGTVTAPIGNVSTFQNTCLLQKGVL